MQSFKVGDKIYEIPIEKLEGTTLQTMMNTLLRVDKENDTIIITDDPEDFQIFYDYISGNVPTQPEALEVLRYYCIPEDTKLGLYKEKYLRENITKPEFEGHEVREPLFNLIHLTKEVWEALELKNICHDDLIFSRRYTRKKSPYDPSTRLVKESWEDIQEKISCFPKVPFLIAGGCVFGILFGVPFNDVDMLEILREFRIEDRGYIDEYVKKRDYKHVIRRSKHALTFRIRRASREYQVILRLYTSPSEVLHGFDVDCCCVGLWEGELYITHRALQAITQGYNKVNLDRLSPSYEYRLAKYAFRGVLAHLDGFYRERVNTEDVDDAKRDLRNADGSRISNYFSPFRGLRGLDLLLMLESSLIRATDPNELKVADRFPHDYDIPGSAIATIGIKWILDEVLHLRPVCHNTGSKSAKNRNAAFI